MNTILRELGHRVDFVESGEAAVAAVARGGYDVVLMDVTLSGIDGIEATRRIRALPGSRPDADHRHFRPQRARRRAGRARGRHERLSRKPVSPAKACAGAGKPCCVAQTLLVPLARSTIRTTSDMMRFSSKSFGV